MTARVVLHVGTPKSGTSHLQDLLSVNREGLEQQGIHYLRTRSGDHFEAALDLIDKPWGGALDQARGQWQALVAQAERAEGDVVVSHEILAAATPAQVARALASFPGREAHVVLTARDLARQIPAEWQEKVKHRGWVSFADFLERVTRSQRHPPDSWFWRVQDVAGILERWGATLPPEHVHLVTLPAPGGPPQTLWDRFGSVLHVDPAAPYAPSRVDNASLGIAEIRALRRLNFLLNEASVSRDTYVNLVREHLVREVLAKRAEKVRPKCPPSLRPYVEEVTEDWLTQISRSGIDVVGDLDDLRPRFVGEDEWIDPDAPDPATVVDAALDVAAAAVIHADRAVETAPEGGTVAPPVRGSRLHRWRRHPRPGS